MNEFSGTESEFWILYDVLACMMLGLWGPECSRVTVVSGGGGQGSDRSRVTAAQEKIRATQRHSREEDVGGKAWYKVQGQCFQIRQREWDVEVEEERISGGEGISVLMQKGRRRHQNQVEESESEGGRQQQTDQSLNTPVCLATLPIIFLIICLFYKMSENSEKDSICRAQVGVFRLCPPIQNFIHFIITWDKEKQQISVFEKLQFLVKTIIWSSKLMLQYFTYVIGSPVHSCLWILLHWHLRRIT